jgi:hypothetical protein
VVEIFRGADAAVCPAHDAPWPRVIPGKAGSEVELKTFSDIAALRAARRARPDIE